MNPRAIVSSEDLELLRVKRLARDEADADWRATVASVARRSSVRSAAQAAGLSPDTVFRWMSDN